MAVGISARMFRKRRVRKRRDGARYKYIVGLGVSGAARAGIEWRDGECFLDLAEIP